MSNGVSNETRITNTITHLRRMMQWLQEQRQVSSIDRALLQGSWDSYVNANSGNLTESESADSASHLIRLMINDQDSFQAVAGIDRQAGLSSLDLTSDQILRAALRTILNTARVSPPSQFNPNSPDFYLSQSRLLTGLSVANSSTAFNLGGDRIRVATLHRIVSGGNTHHYRLLVQSTLDSNRVQFTDFYLNEGALRTGISRIPGANADSIMRDFQSLTRFVSTHFRADTDPTLARTHTTQQGFVQIGSLPKEQAWYKMAYSGNSPNYTTTFPNLEEAIACLNNVSSTDNTGWSYIRNVDNERVGWARFQTNGMPVPAPTPLASAPPAPGGNTPPAPNPTLTNTSTSPAPNQTSALTSVRLGETRTPGVFLHPDGYYVYVLPDGYLLYVRSTRQDNAGDVQISASGTPGSWTGIGSVNSAAVTGNAHIQAGIRAIATARGTPAALSNAPTPLLTTEQAIERFRVFENQCQLPAINLRTRHAGDSNTFSQSTYYLMCALASRCGAVNDTTFREELTRMIGNRPIDMGWFNSTSRTLNFVRQNCPALVPAGSLNPNEYYACLIEELMCGKNGSCETTMITHLPTDIRSFSDYTGVGFFSARHLPVNNLIHIFTTDGGMNPIQAALINTRIQQFAHLSVTNFYQGSNSWNDNYVQEIVRGIIRDPELGLTTERGREAMRRVLERVFNAFNHRATFVSTTDNYQRFSEADLRTIAGRGRESR